MNDGFTRRGEGWSEFTQSVTVTATWMIGWTLLLIVFGAALL